MQPGIVPGTFARQRVAASELQGQWLQANAEVGMAMELWWRAAALEALKALLLSPLVTTPTLESGKLQRRVAAVLQPTLAVVLASPVLQASLCADLHFATVFSPAIL